MCRIGGLELGPLPFEELVAFAKSGQLQADDDVKLGTNGNWLQAGLICRLMAAISSAASSDQPERASVRFEPSRTEPSRTGASAQRLMKNSWSTISSSSKPSEVGHVENVPHEFQQTPRTPAPKTSPKAPPTPTPQTERAPTIARPTPTPVTAKNEVAPIVRPTPLPSTVATTPPPAATVAGSRTRESSDRSLTTSATTTSATTPIETPVVSVAPRAWSPPKARWQIPNVASAIQPLWEAARASESLPKLGGAMPSDYQVAIYATEEPPQNTPRPDDFQMRPTDQTPGEPPPELKPPKLLIPERYTKPKESGLAFTVSASTRNEFDIKLTGTPP